MTSAELRDAIGMDGSQQSVSTVCGTLDRLVHQRKVVRSGERGAYRYELMGDPHRRAAVKQMVGIMVTELPQCERSRLLAEVLTEFLAADGLAISWIVKPSGD